MRGQSGCYRRRTVLFGPVFSIIDTFRESVHTNGQTFDIMWRNQELIPYGRQVIWTIQTTVQARVYLDFTPVHTI